MGWVFTFRSACVADDFSFSGPISGNTQRLPNFHEDFNSYKVNIILSTYDFFYPYIMILGKDNYL